MSKKERTYNRLTEERVNFLKDSYIFLSDEKLAEILGYNNAASVRKIRQLLGLKRTKEELLKKLKEVPMVVWMPRELYDKDISLDL